MEIILKIKDDIYKQLEDGKPGKLIKRGVITTISLNTNDIIAVTDIVNNRGQIMKNFCRIYLKEIGQLVVNHSKEYINNIKQIKPNKIGFRQRYTGKNKK